MRKIKWFKDEKCWLYIGKRTYYSFGSNQKKNYLISSSSADWDSGSFRRIKNFTVAKKIVELLENK